MIVIKFIIDYATIIGIIMNMDELQRLYEHQTMMAIGIYSFLDNLLTHLPPSPRNHDNDDNYLSSTSSIHLSTGQHHHHHHTNNTDELNTSIGDMFYGLNQQRTSSTWLLNDMNSSTISNPQLYSSTLYGTTIISRLTDNTDTTYTTTSNNNSNNNNTESISNEVKPGVKKKNIYVKFEAYQCQNQHKFCYGCIYTWSTGPTAGHDSCPVCRCDGLYAKNFDLNERIDKKRVRCPMDGCNWMGLLSVYAQHEHRRYSPYELDLLLIDCRKDQLKSSSTSLLPITQNQAVYNKEMPIKYNEIPQRFQVSEINNNNSFHYPGQVPIVCEPINQSTDQLSEISTRRLLTTHRRVRPLRNENRQRHNRIQNRPILSTDESMNQLRQNNNQNSSMEEMRVNDAYGIMNYTHSHRLHGEQHQQRVTNTPVHLRQTRSHITSGTHSNGNISRNIGHRQCVNIRDSRIRQRHIRSEQTQQPARVCDNGFNPINDTNNSLNIDTNIIQNHCVEGNILRDSTDSRIADQHINTTGNNTHISLPAITSNLYTTQSLINNTQSLLMNNTSIQERTSQPLEFRRLVPQRQRRVVEQLRETREQLAAMLRLMTMELEERQNRALHTNLDMITRSRVLRNPNYIFRETTDDNLPTSYVNSSDTVNHELTEHSNQYTTSISRNLNRSILNQNDIQSNHYTNQSYHVPTSTNNNTMDLSRTLLTPTYREQTIATSTLAANNTQQNIVTTNNNGQYSTPVTSITNITQTSSSPLISTTRLLARLRLNALQQTTPLATFTPNNLSNRLGISSSLTTSSTTTDNDNNDNNGQDNEEDDTDATG
ncbi:TNF receptor-associated factor 2 [Schistosoma japonicum]|nr:TNF receptor-associated factor 2 [Schistosoma japonicum]